MKKTILILFIIQSMAGIAQVKNDYVWLFGYETAPNNILFGGSIMDFNDDTVRFERKVLEINFDYSSASLSDTEGNLQSYSNGLAIVNKHHQIIEGANCLNEGVNLGDLFGISYPQGVLMLPMPDHPNITYVIHEGSVIITEPSFMKGCSPLYQSTFDVSLNQGNGQLFNKNVELLTDTLNVGKLTATKHANGRDWWIIVPEFNSNIYQRLLLTPSGIEVLSPQEVGTTTFSSVGQAVFSPDGSKYVSSSIVKLNENYLNIYDFDRCTGMLSNHQQLFHEDYDSAGGVAISPSSRFLYYSSFTEIIQFDLWLDTPFNMPDTIGIYDGYLEPIVLNGNDSFSIATPFFACQLAPNNKVYINCPNTVRSLHVIHQPDLEGNACDFEQHAIQLPTLNHYSIPNFPNFRLGALEGSSCDTITSTEEILKIDYQLYPNPTQGLFTLAYKPQSSAELFQLIDIDGRVVLEQGLKSFRELHDFSISQLPRGMYFWTVFSEGKSIIYGKVIKE